MRVREQSPIDGGYAWVILLASFLAHVIQFGFSYSVGVWYTAFIDEYAMGRQYVALISSLHMASFFAAGPVSSLMTNLYGCRCVCVAGALIGCAGVLLSVFANSVYALYVTFGIIAGFGFGFSFVPDIVAIGYYFEKRRSFAVGLAVSGLGIGNFVFPKIITYLMDTYGLGGALLIVGGLCLNLVAIGALFRPWTGDREAALNCTVHSEPSRDQYDANQTLIEPQSRDSKQGNLLNENKVDLMLSKTSLEQSKISGIGSKTTINSLPMQGKLQRSPQSVYRTASICDLLPGQIYASNHSLRRQCLSKGSQSITGSDYILSKSLHSIRNPNSYDQVKETDSESQTSVARRTSWRQKLDLDLLQSKGFVALCINNTLFFLGQSTVYVHLGAYAKETLLLTNAQSANFFSALGFFNFVGRFAFGVLCQVPFFKPMWVYTAGLFSAGVVTIVCPLVDGYWWLMAYAVLFGFLCGSFSTLPNITIQVTELDRLSSAFGYILVSEAVGCLLGPPLAGFVYDVTGVYKNSIYLGGVFIVTANLVMAHFGAAVNCAVVGIWLAVSSPIDYAPLR